MALDRMTYPPRALDRELVTLCVLFGFDNTAPTVLKGPATVARTSAGKYIVTFPFDLNIRGVSLCYLSDGLSGTQAPVMYAEYVEVDVPGRQIRVIREENSDVGTRLDMSGDDLVSLVVYHQNTSG